MADTSHKCCSAALCNNRSENRKDLIFHNFPLDENLRKIWSIKMRRGDKKFASNTSLFCCWEHFTAEDYRKSLTGKRHDQVMKMLFHRSFLGQRIVKNRVKVALEQKLVKTAQVYLLWCHQK